MESVDQEIRKQNPLYTCTHCMPGCFALNFDSTFSTAKIFEQTPFLRENKLNPKNIAILYVYYTKSTFRSQKMEELVSFTDFLCMFIIE